MVDTKKLKEVASTSTATAAAAGMFPAPAAVGAPQVLTVSTVGVQFVTFASADGTTTISIVADNAPAPATPVGVFIEGVFRAALPTYADGDAVVPHFDSRGRLLVSPGETGLTADIDADQAAGPATPVGLYQIGKREATLPTYADGDNSVFHFDERGRLINRLAPGGTGTTSNVAGSASSVTLLTANTARIGATIFNDSTEDLLVKFGATASSTSFTVKLAQDDYYEVPANYIGIIDGIWGAATGSARITEIT